MAPATNEITFIDRESGQLRAEQVYGERELRFLYETRLGTALVNALVKKEWFSHIAGLLNRSSLSRRKILPFIRRYDINESESEFAAASYRSFDDFFARKLRPESRPIDPDTRHLVAPAEGRALAFANVPAGGFQVKDCAVSVDELVGELDGFQPGTSFVIRLAPCDYHRFHFPADGLASSSVHMGRDLHSVHPIALAAAAPSFQNKRMVTMISSSSARRMIQIEVGALTIGSIVQTYQRGPVQRGQEKGYFHFGGSTVILLTEAGHFDADEDLLDATARGLETLIKVGTRIGAATNG